MQFFFCLAAAVITVTNAGAQTKVKVSGTIADAFGPVGGVAVQEKGTSNGIVTNPGGKYEISVSSNATLLVSCLGYASQEIAVNGKSVIDISLSEDSELLQETVVIGFGTQKKVDLSGSVASVNVSKLTESRPVTSIGNALSGMAAGVNVTSASNAPGSDDATILVRGRGTLNNASPLVIIDGVEAPINSVNPQDVESMSVLKDAASSAIYGSRAANGVILITTKKGKAGSVKVDYNGYVSVETARIPDWLQPVSNYADYMEYMNEGYVNSGSPAKFSESKIAEWRNASDPLMYPNTNWIEEVFRPAVSHKHLLSINAGSEKMRLYTSLGYLNNPGVVENAGQRKYSARINFEMDPLKWFTFGSNISGYVSDLDSGSNPDVNTVAVTPGMTFRLPDGRFGGIENPEEDLQACINNPIMKQYKISGTNKTNSVNARFYGVIRPFKGFSITGSYTYQFRDQQKNTIPNFHYLYSYQTGEAVSNTVSKTYATNYNAKLIRKYGDIVARYENKFFNDRLGFNIMAGGSTESYRSSSFQATKYDLLQDNLTAIDAATGDMSCKGNAEEWAMNSYFGRLNLSWDDKYLFEANLRADGSSRFLDGYRWGYFPSASAAWRISQEDFMKNVPLNEL